MDFNQFPDRYKEKCRKWDKAKIAEEFGAVPDDFIPMWIADMDFKAPETLLQKLHETVDIGVFGYTYVYDEFYHAVINYYQKHHHISPAKDWLTLCYGTVGTLHYVVQAFCQTGDYVILQTPVYSPFQNAIKAHDAICITNPMIVKHNRYYIDFEDFEEKLRTYKPKLYMLCNPHNPSGRVWSRADLKQLAQLCQKYGTIVVSDEVHSGMIYQGPFTSLCQLDEAMDNTILLSSPNKKYNLGGLKTSFAIIKNEAIRQIFKQRLTKNSVTSPNVFGIIAMTTCLNDGDDWSQACMDYVDSNYQFVTEYIQKELPVLSFMEMESSYLMWVNIQKTGLSSDIFTKELATEYGVLLENGNHFIADGEGYVRINLGTQQALVKECFYRIKAYLSGKGILG